MGLPASRYVINRLQIFGSSEMNYLRALDPVARSAAIQRLSKYKICCIVVTKGQEVPEELIQLSREESIPVLRSKATSSISMKNSELPQVRLCRG
jgi:HPr kinase/phosphorylase